MRTLRPRPEFYSRPTPCRYDRIGAKPGQETEKWRRFQHYMHCAEGSLMPLIETWFLAFCEHSFQSWSTVYVILIACPRRLPSTTSRAAQCSKTRPTSQNMLMQAPLALTSTPANCGRNLSSISASSSRKWATSPTCAGSTSQLQIL